MKTATLLLSISLLLGFVLGCQNPNVPDYDIASIAGDYSGTYYSFSLSGGDTGTIDLTINTNGIITGNSASTVTGAGIISGTVDQFGIIEFTSVLISGDTLSFTLGVGANGAIVGSWTNLQTNDSGQYGLYSL
ncbi:MAG: hypothetical protein DRP70_16585 [Spirochaetes bacterium]|nr:MAG: hypothetical protein DRP70_16585 [Spirochaetota bacterium]